MEKEQANLKIYVKLLLQRKELIIAITVISLILAVIFNFFVFKPVYRGSASVSIAQINYVPLAIGQISNVPLLKAKDVQSQITSDAFMQKLSQDIGISYKMIAGSMGVSTSQDSRIVIISFDSEDKEIIKKFFRYFIVELNNFNNEAYKIQIEALKGQISLLQSQVNSLDKQAEEVLAKLKSLEQKGATNSEYVLEYSQLRTVYDSIVSNKIDLVKKIAEIEAAVNGSNTFFYQSEPVIVDTPVKPRKLFNVAVTTLIAFLSSILLAFFVEYWERES